MSWPGVPFWNEALSPGGGGGTFGGAGTTGLPKLEGSVYIASPGAEIIVTEQPLNQVALLIPPGLYYPNTADRMPALLAYLASALTASSLAATYTVVADDDYDDSTGRVRIAASGGGVTSFSIGWAGAPDLRDALGFAATLTGALSYTSPNSSRLWLPDSCRGPSAYAPDPHEGQTVTDGRVIRSPSFKGRAVSRARGKVHQFSFPLLRGRKAWQPFEVVPNESWETWFSNVIGAGRKFRYHPDRANDADFYPRTGGYRSPAIDNMHLSPFDGEWTSGDLSLWMQGPIDAWKDTR